LEKASCATLSHEEIVALKRTLYERPEIAMEMLEPDIHSFAGTIEHNAELFRELILPLLLNSPLREEYSF